MSTEDSNSSQEPRDEQEKTLQDLLRRAIGSGARAVKESEERIRDLATKIVTSERVEAVVGTIGQLREDLVSVAGRELRRYFDRLNLTDEIVKVLTAISLELKTEIRFIPNDKRLVRPKVKSEISVRREGRQTESDDGDADEQTIE